MDNLQPYRDLWAAVLNQAAVDAWLSKRANRMSARYWLKKESPDGGSFPWVCQLLGLEVKKSRAAILNHRDPKLRAECITRHAH